MTAKMTSEQFKSLRDRLHLTQEELAAKLGTHQPNIARIESGARQPTAQQAAAITLLAALIDCQKSTQ